MRKFMLINFILIAVALASWQSGVVNAFVSDKEQSFTQPQILQSQIGSTPESDPEAEPEEDTFYLNYRNNSWKIPDEIIKTNDLWIEIDLTQQMLYVYRGGQLIDGFLISSGTRDFKTVTGIFKIYAKYPSIDMRGPGYDLAGVPFTMFFHKGYAIHGTYWHNFFGTPMSRGCINMVTEEAAWLYENSPVGTYVIVHY